MQLSGWVVITAAESPAQSRAAQRSCLQQMAAAENDTDHELIHRSKCENNPCVDPSCYKFRLLQNEALSS